ncbi:hypothetical protein HBH50_088210 [Parastagonospora nodorum]|nr:hypothetical protein HBH50_088210 [Parastagonospora nodorum]KAH4092988.1 hypothetical protein HBH48_075170 [Parastagonospora nodorum]
MCAKDNLVRQKSPLSTSTQTPNYVDTFSSDFAFSFANILLLIAFIISYCLFADELNIQQSLLDRATVVLIIISVDKTQLLLILGDVAAYTLLARFIPTTKIRDPFLKKRCLNKGHDDFVHLVNCFGWKHYNFNIYVSLATDTLHLLLKGLVIKMLDFMQDILDDIYPSTVVSLLFVLKAPFALHFIRVVCDLVTLAQYKNIRMYGALDSICTRANSEAYYITIVKQFYSMTNKKEYILQIYRKHIAYIRAFSEVLLFNNNRQIDNTTRMLSTLQAFKFYDLSMIIRLVHLILRDLPNLTTHTTMSYYVNNYIN